MDGANIRGLGVDSNDQEDLIWLVAGFFGALLCLALIGLSFLICRTFTCNRVPNKINANAPSSNLVAAETRSESEVHESNIQDDDTSEITGMWSFSLKSFPGRSVTMPHYENEQQSDAEMEDVELESSLYTGFVETMSRPPSPRVSDIQSDRSRSVRFRQPVEV
jgi:predicted lipid-binding transport protein (Tim44 family)